MKDTQWEADLNTLASKGLISSREKEAIEKFPLDDYIFHRETMAADDFLMAKYSKIMLTPEKRDLESMIAFSKICAQYHHFRESQAITERAFEYIGWIDKSYLDAEDDPFPLKDVKDIYFKKLKNKEQADLLGQYLGSRANSEPDK